ncbi:DUF6059 family protein [Nonomuraea sp. NPDC049400]|uniref:DUF6059 family protein n=1 Tax=Nonomuraea sp. NPDC049400 TaxID=3364352 RepID=UPI0037BA0AD1
MLARLARGLIKFIWDGLVGVGRFSGMAPFLVIPPDNPPPSLPEGHPEQLIPDVPPTPEEARLWKELNRP